MDMDFQDWINQELNQRGWSIRELARRTNLYPGTISKVLNYKNKPGQDFCLAISKALKLPPEEVFRRAGLLPDLPAPLEELSFEELSDVMKRLSARDQLQVVQYARMLYRLSLEEKEDARKGATLSRVNHTPA